MQEILSFGGWQTWLKHVKTMWNYVRHGKTVKPAKTRVATDINQFLYVFVVFLGLSGMAPGFELP
jgi:hypothetical protein